MTAEAPTWLVQQVIAARLEAILVAGGYFTDAGERVDLEPFKATEAEDLAFPRIAVGDGTLTFKGQALTAGGMSTNWSFDVTVEAYAKAEVDTAERDASRLKFDVVRALATVRAEDFAQLEGVRVTTYALSGDVPTLRRPDGISFNVVQATATITFVYLPQP